MAIAIFKISDKEVEYVSERMAEIKVVDSSFRYDIVKARDGKGYLLILLCKDKDEAHRRALWVWDKVFGKDRAYWVKEGKGK